METPATGTVERWAWDYVLTTSLEAKLAPVAPPAAWERSPTSRRLSNPGRAPELLVVARAPKTRGLSSARGRARAMHTFLHHEVQAAELMAWAILAYAGAPAAFREGLLRIALDEIRHMGMYAAYLARVGHRYGEFPVRDWFWERVPACADPIAFVAVMGLGIESANLEHSATFAARFRDAGDEDGAAVQEAVGREEIAHVRFGARWFEELTGGLDFDRWRRSLPPPLSPMLMRGRPLQRALRLRAGQTERFVTELEAWQPTPRGP